MPRVGIALGSNLGDRLANLHFAIASLRKIATPHSDFFSAAIYQTEPLLCPPGSPLFYNTAVEIGYSGSAFELLRQTQTIEQQLGRITKVIRNAPRIVDLDLLYFGDEISNHGSLVLPHPRLHQRRFVLQPLAEIVPTLKLPGHHQTIAELLANLASSEPPLVIVEAAANAAD